MESLKKVFSVIDLLGERRGMRLQEIAEELHLCKSTAHRIVTALCFHGYLAREEETKKYRLGLKFVEISNQVLENIDIREAANESIEELNRITNETIHLAMLLGNEAIYIDKKESNHAIRMYSRIGKIAPLYCTGVGKVILAFQPKETLTKLIESIGFQKYTANTIIGREALLKELYDIRKRGYAMDREEHEQNMICIAAPIRDYTKKVVASVSITAVSPRMSIRDLLSFRKLLTEKGSEISRRLGYTG